MFLCTLATKWAKISSTVEPHYNEVLGTMKITLLYQVSHYIRVKKQRNIKSWDQQNYLVIRGFCYSRPLYNEVPLYLQQNFNTLATKWANISSIYSKISKVGGMFRDFQLKPYPMFREFSQKSYLLERHTPVLPYTASTPPPPPPPPPGFLQTSVYQAKWRECIQI